MTLVALKKLFLVDQMLAVNFLTNNKVHFVSAVKRKCTAIVLKIVK